MAKPTRANRALVPALCAAGLALGIVLQLASTNDVELPDEGGFGGRTVAEMPSIAGQSASPILLERPIFSPSRTANSATDLTLNAPLGGAMVAGAVSIKGRSYAVLQRPDGIVRRLAVGGHYEGWKLQSLSPTGAVFGQGAQRLSLPFGVASLQTAMPTAEVEEE